MDNLLDDCFNAFPEMNNSNILSNKKEKVLIQSYNKVKAGSYCAYRAIQQIELLNDFEVIL